MKSSPGRKLEDLVSVGPAIRRDLELLGIHTAARLAQHEPEALYHELCLKTGKRQDPCVLDTFRAAIEPISGSWNPEIRVDCRLRAGLN
jgi:Pathogenicity locus